MDDDTIISTVEIIQRLKNSSCDGDGLRSLFKNKLIKSLENEEDDDLMLEVISLVLGSSVQVLALDELDTILLEPFLPVTATFLCKKLNTNHIIIEETSCFEENSVTPDVLRNIEVSIQVLRCLDDLLTYLTNVDQMAASDFSSSQKNIGNIVLLVFNHCQGSKTEYKHVFPEVRSELMALFQQCYQVQVKLYTLLNEKLIFNCAFEEEVQLLIDMFDILNPISEVVAQLDTMSLVAHWKAFAKLTQTYAVHLRSRLDVARPIAYLAANLTYQLTNLTNYINAESNAIVRALKVSGLQLKVLIKLCEHFKDFLGDCHKPLLCCLIALTAHTPRLLRQEGMTAEVAAQVNTHLSAGAAPLLTHLLADPIFIQTYFQHAAKLQSSTVCEKFGYCNLTNIILKKLIQQNSTNVEAKKLWLTPELPLLETIFKILHNFADVFFTYEEDTYQALLTHTAAFIIVMTSTAMFPSLERLLIKHLLQPSLWPALLVSDLLCLIARVGSSELCLQLTVLLSDLCSCWPVWDRCRPEWVYVTWTLSRLTHFLATDDLKIFPSHLPAVTAVGSDITKLLDTPFSDESLSMYDSVIERLTVLQDLLDLIPQAKTTLAQPVYRLWQHMIVQADGGFTETSEWFSILFSVLVVVTTHIVASLDNSQIANILEVLEKVSGSGASVFKCGACTILRSLASRYIVNDTNQSTVFHKVSSLFVQLMLDKNLLIKQLALETFSYFAYVTKHEEIVASTVAKDNNLQNEITHYLEGVVIVQSDFDFLQHIASLKAPFVHTCKLSKLKPTRMEDIDFNPCKKLKTSSGDKTVSEVLKSIEKDLNSIEEFAKCSEVTKKLVFKCIVNRIDEVVKAF